MSIRTQAIMVVVAIVAVAGLTAFFQMSRADPPSPGPTSVYPVTTPEPTAPSRDTESAVPPSNPKRIAPVPAAQMEALQTAHTALIDLMNKHQTEVSDSKVMKAWESAITEIATERGLHPKCYFKRVQQGTALHSTCVDAGALWGLDDLGRVAVQEPPKAPQGPVRSASAPH